ncbi:MAG: hypothetical protein HYY44_07260 [Deltaproteobacteria bacterium]|nr:hypothetical protein [Deltaproteobacteria bacterium]MBI4374410.1 hypothetical protein [Deltaproteobacteria bacterium]
MAIPTGVEKGDQCLRQSVEWNLEQIGPIRTRDDWQRFLRKDLLPLARMYQACEDIYLPNTVPDKDAAIILAGHLKTSPYFQTRMTAEEKRTPFTEMVEKIYGPTPDHFWGSVGWGSLVVAGALLGVGSIFLDAKFNKPTSLSNAIVSLVEHFGGWGLLIYGGIFVAAGVGLGAGLGYCRNEWEREKRSREVDSLMAG